MKKIYILLILSIAALFTSCSKDNKIKETLFNYNNAELEKSFYADETLGKFTFTASEAWSTSITTPSKLEDVNWVKLDRTSGLAGDVTMSIKLEKNYTGEDRFADVNIICGKSNITISIAQKSANENGKPLVKVVSKLSISDKYISNGVWREAKDALKFNYDDKGRIISVVNDEVYATLEYNDGAINTVANPDFSSINISYVLDENNRVTRILGEDDELTIEYSDNYVIKADSPQDIVWSNGNIAETTWYWDGKGNGDKLTYEYSEYTAKNINLDLNFLFLGAWESTAYFLDDYCDIHIVQMQGYFGERCNNYISSISSIISSETGDSYKDMKMEYKFNNDGTLLQIVRKLYSKEKQNGEGELSSIITVDVEY